MSYASVVWMESNKEYLTKILRLQKRAARVILDAPPQASSVELFNRLKWIPFYEEAKISKAVLAYKRLHHLVPQYFMDVLKLNSDFHGRTSRYSSINLM